MIGTKKPPKQRPNNVENIPEHSKILKENSQLNNKSRDRKKGSLRKGSFHWKNKSLESLKSLDSLENGRILLYFPESGVSLESLNSLESLENGLL